jgi:hypothetical protein
MTLIIGQIIANGILLQYQPDCTEVIKNLGQNVYFTINNYKFRLSLEGYEIARVHIDDQNKCRNFAFRCFCFDDKVIELELWQINGGYPRRWPEQLCLYERRINDPGCFIGIRQTIDECLEME